MMDKATTTVSHSYEVKQPDGSSKSVRVRQVNNGFIICVESYIPSSGSGDSYKESKWHTEEYISTKNPFALNEKEVKAPSLQMILDACC